MDFNISFTAECQLTFECWQIAIWCTILRMSFLCLKNRLYVLLCCILLLLSSYYASCHIGQGQVSSTLLFCWLFFLFCPRCILFHLFHFRWCASMLVLVFLFVFSLLVSILGLPLSSLQMVCVEHDQAISIYFESTKSPCPWCLWCFAGLCWRFCSVRISSLSVSDWCYGSWRVCWCLYELFSSTVSHIGAQIVHICYKI